MTNVVSAFVLDLVERAVKTAAQSALAVYSVDAILHTGSLVHLGQVAAGAAIFSVLTSLASQPFGNKASASLLPSSKAPAQATTQGTSSAPVAPAAVASDI